MTSIASQDSQRLIQDWQPHPSWLRFNYSRLVTALVVSILTSACATNLLKKKDYEETRLLLAERAYQDALYSFPREQSRQGFITSVEKGWIELLNGKASSRVLLKTAESLRDKDVISITKEASQYFYIETEDGYIPAEHEIIWLHIITGLHFAREGKLAESRVEVTKATELLQNKANFDDSAIRVLLAGLWIACGEWDHARVDLRQAAALNSELTWARELAAQDKPPGKLHILLRGIGPEPVWNPKKNGPDTGSNQYRSEGVLFPASPLANRESYLININSRKQKTIIPVSTSGWYQRHQMRNHEIRDILAKSKYMVTAGMTELSASTDAALNTVGTGVFMTGAIAIGVVSCAAGLYVIGATASLGGDAWQLGGLVAGGGLLLAANLYDDSLKAHNRQKLAIERMREDPARIANSYRYVRFIPDTISAIPSEVSDVEIRLGEKYLDAFLSMKDLKSNSQVLFYFDPR